MQDRESLSERIIRELLEVNKWYLVLFGIISAEIITALSVLIISSMFYPEMQGILLRIGVFVSFIASLLVGGALVYLFSEIKQARLSNVGLKDDISKRMKMEEALRESEEKYRGIFENVQDMIIFVDTRGNLIDINRRTEDVIGYKREELIGRNFLKLKLFKTKDLPKITKLFFDSVKSGKVFEADDRLQNVMELPLQHKDGHTVHVETSTAIIKKDGKVEGFLSVIRDVTWRKKVDKEMELLQDINTAMNSGMVLDDLLQVAADGMKDIFEFSSSGIYLLDKDTNELVFKTVSFDSKILRKIEKMTGLKMGGLRIPLYEGSGFREVIEKKEPIISDDIEKFFKDFTDDKKLWPLVGQVKRLAGFKLIVRVPLIVWGEVIGIVGASVKREGQDIDINALERFASQLALAVRKSRAEEAIKGYAGELEQSNRMKGLFMDVMHHDIMNPAGVIKNAAEIIEMDEELKDPSKMAIIKRNTRKIMEIVESAMTYSRLEPGVDTKKEILDLNELIINVIGDLKANAKEKNQSILFAPRGEQKIRAGAIIDSIFSNLVSNAIKYSGDGTEITINVKDDGDSKIISVKDQGEGIADGHKESIFNRFMRREKGSVKGSGLGLAIVKRIVDLHNGRVWVEDNPDGKGSVFRVSLPKS